jgi:hypothetical protein
LNYLLKIKVLIGLCATLSVSLLLGCSSQSEALYKTLQISFSNTSRLIDNAPLKDNLNYLRVNINGLDALLVLGYVENDGDEKINVWYSKEGSVLRIKEGRYFGSLGFDQEWRTVKRNNSPSFNNLLTTEMASLSQSSSLESSSRNTQPNKRYFFTQTYSEFPSYRHVMEERMSNQVIQAPQPVIPSSMKKFLPTDGIVWIYETTAPIDRSFKKNPPFAWYAFVKKKDSYQQILGQQCLSADYCLTWIPWPIKP